MKNPVRTGTMIALAAASLFAGACKKSEETSSNKPSTTETKPATGDEKTAKVHCQGVNECKGQGGCKSVANTCAGQNGCKGKGFIDTATEEDCKAKGGTVMAAKM